VSDEFESQIEVVEEASVAEAPAPVGRGPGAAYRRATRPIRRGLSATRTWYDHAPKVARASVVLAAIALAALLPQMLPYLTAQADYWTFILTKIGTAALLALGLNVVVGFAGLLDLGYVAFFAVGAYSFAVLSGAAKFAVVQYEVSSGKIHGVSALDYLPRWRPIFWLIFFAAIAIAVVAGVLLGAPTLRLRGDYLAIVTLGFGEIVRVTANNSDSTVNGPRGVQSIPHPELFGYKFLLANIPYYYLLLAIIVIWIFFLRRLNDSRIGRSWAAIREDELAAAAMGIPTVRMKLMAFAIGAAVASLGGVVYAAQVGFISPDTFSLFNVSFGSVTILAMVTIGGMGGIAGPIVGAALVIFLPEYFRFLQDGRLMVFGAALVIVMILRPQGLIPSRRRAAELKGGDVRDTSMFEVREMDRGGH
jgi:branched-chain amino acid transport system permease protein